MRSALILSGLLAMMSVPVLGQSSTASGGYWSVRPAPQSWGLPPAPPAPAQAAAEAASAVSASEGSSTLAAQEPQRAQAQFVRAGGSLDEALQCAAALQISTLAAPAWSRENGVAAATNGWLARVFTLSEPAGVKGDQVSDLVRAEMERQTNAAANDPSALSRRAFDCATRPPA